MALVVVVVDEVVVTEADSVVDEAAVTEVADAVDSVVVSIVDPSICIQTKRL